MSRQSFVLDCSVTMSWLFQDEQNLYAQYILQNIHQFLLHVPIIWPLEINNVLLVSERKNRISHQQALSFKQSLQQFPIEKNQGIGYKSLALAAKNSGVGVFTHG